MAETTRSGPHPLASTLTRTSAKGRLARLAGATAVAGLVAGGLTLAAAPANAATIINPNCPVPSNVVFQETGHTTLVFPPGSGRFPITSSSWQATYNGQHYVGTSVLHFLQQIAPNEIDPPAGESASCQVG